jgi:hypothetical protein
MEIRYIIYEAVIGVDGIQIYRTAPGEDPKPCSQLQRVGSLTDAEMWMQENDWSMDENWHLFSAHDGLRVVASVIHTSDPWSSRDE